MQWDQTLQTGRIENWPTILGRLNAALNQGSNLNDSIEDVLEHFVYLPKKCTVNPQDVPFFLSTRLADPPVVEDSSAIDGASSSTSSSSGAENNKEDPAKVLRVFEEETAKMAKEFERDMVRY